MLAHPERPSIERPVERQSAESTLLYSGE
jgi:hypothetical protein